MSGNVPNWQVRKVIKLAFMVGRTRIQIDTEESSGQYWGLHTPLLPLCICKHSMVLHFRVDWWFKYVWTTALTNDIQINLCNLSPDIVHTVIFYIIMT